MPGSCGTLDGIRVKPSQHSGGLGITGIDPPSFSHSTGVGVGAAVGVGEGVGVGVGVGVTGCESPQPAPSSDTTKTTISKPNNEYFMSTPLSYTTSRSSVHAQQTPHPKNVLH